MQVKLSKENRKLYQGSLKRNVAQDHFVKSEGIRSSQSEHLRYLCMSRGRDEQRMPSENWARSQHDQIYHRDQEYEASRRQQALLHEELPSREKAQRDDRVTTIQEVEGLKEICCSEAVTIQGLRADDFSRPELRESQSTANQQTVQTQEH